MLDQDGLFGPHGRVWPRAVHRGLACPWEGGGLTQLRRGDPERVRDPREVVLPELERALPSLGVGIREVGLEFFEGILSTAHRRSPG